MRLVSGASHQMRQLEAMPELHPQRGPVREHARRRGAHASARLPVGRCRMKANFCLTLIVDALLGREIQRLTLRIRELELELARSSPGSASSSSSAGSVASSAASGSTESSATTTPSLPPLSTCCTGPSADSDQQPKRVWGGIYASTTHSSPKQVRRAAVKVDG